MKVITPSPGTETFDLACQQATDAADRAYELGKLKAEARYHAELLKLIEARNREHEAAEYARQCHLDAWAMDHPADVSYVAGP